MPAAATGRREASSPSPAYTAVEAAVLCASRRGGGHAAASGQGDDCAAGWRAARARRTGAEATPPAPDPSLQGTRTRRVTSRRRRPRPTTRNEDGKGGRRCLGAAAKLSPQPAARNEEGEGRGTAPPRWALRRRMKISAARWPARPPGTREKECLSRDRVVCGVTLVSLGCVFPRMTRLNMYSMTCLLAVVGLPLFAC